VGNLGRCGRPPPCKGRPRRREGVPDWREAGGGGSARWGGGVGDPGLSVETEERWIFTGSGFVEPPTLPHHPSRATVDRSDNEERRTSFSQS